MKIEFPIFLKKYYWSRKADMYRIDSLPALNRFIKNKSGVELNGIIPYMPKLNSHDTKFTNRNGDILFNGYTVRFAFVLDNIILTIDNSETHIGILKNKQFVYVAEEIFSIHPDLIFNSDINIFLQKEQLSYVFKKLGVKNNTVLGYV